MERNRLTKYFNNPGLLRSFLQVRGTLTAEALDATRAVALIAMAENGPC